MLLNTLVRRLASTLAFPAAFAVPVTAVAHGEAHEHATLHSMRHSVADDHHRNDRTGHSVRNGTGIASFSHSDDFGEHPHLKIDATVASRVALIAGATVPALVELPLAKALSLPGARGPFAHPRVAAHRSHAPPPSLRSPPPTIS